MHLLDASQITTTLHHCILRSVAAECLGGVRSSSGKASDRVKLNLFWFPLAVRWQDESQWKCVEWWLCHKSEKHVPLLLTVSLYKLSLLSSSSLYS